MIRRTGLRAALALSLALGPALPAGSEGRVLTPGQMRNLAAVALDARDPGTAMTLTSALLERDPEDVQALLIRSRAARDAGDYRLAEKTARQAWSLSEDDRTRHAASLAMAQALSSQGQRTRAQLWLRRAAQVAPSPAARAAAVRDFRYVRSRNRWSTQLQFNVAPKSNINNGSARSTFTEILFGREYELPLPGAAQALAGTELSVGVATRYRVAETTRRATDLTFSAGYTTYALTEGAKTLAPGAKGSDYALGTLTTGIAQKWLSKDGRTEYTLDGSIGRSWYSGDPYGNHVEAEAGVNRALDRNTRLSFSAKAEFTRGPNAPHSDAVTLSAQLGRALESGGQVTLWVSATESRSDVNVARFTNYAAGIQYAPAMKVLGASPRFGLGLRKRDYPVSSFAPGHRNDVEQSAWIDLTFREIDYFGFHPTVRVQASRSNSNINLFDIDRSGISFGIGSSY